MPGETEGEQLDPLAVLMTQVYMSGNSAPACVYRQREGTHGDLYINLLAVNRSISFDPSSHPYFHAYTGSGGSLYECITSGASPEVCQL